MSYRTMVVQAIFAGLLGVVIIYDVVGGYHNTYNNITLTALTVSFAVTVWRLSKYRTP